MVSAWGKGRGVPEVARALKAAAADPSSRLDAASVWSLGPEYVGPNLLYAGRVSVRSESGEEASSTINGQLSAQRAWISAAVEEGAIRGGGGRPRRPP